MGLSLHQHGHSHGGHSHGDIEIANDDDLKEEHSKKNINVRAAFIHVLGDFIQSIGVLIAALIIYFKVLLQVFPVVTFSRFFSNRIFTHISCDIYFYVALKYKFSLTHLHFSLIGA